MNRRSVFSNLMWSWGERMGAEAVAFVVSVILARLLSPSDYGTVALMGVFTGILGQFTNIGLNQALIQKKDADDADFSTVFYANIAFSIVCYGILFAAAPGIAAFYETPIIKPMLRVSGLGFLIGSLNGAQSAYVSRTLQYKRFFFATLGGTIGAAVVGIWMAYRGYGAWALIAQSLFNSAVDTLILWLTVGWRPKRLFSMDRLRGLLSYGWKMFASALLDVTYGNLRSLIIGKLYTSEDLAQYNRGSTWPGVLMSNVNSAINSVLLPTMSRVQDDPATVKNMARRAIKTSTYLTAPMMVGLGVVAEPLARFILTEKWLPCVPYMRIFCVTYIFYPIHTSNLNAIQAMGRSDLFLKLEVIKKVVGLAVLLLTMSHGVMAMAYSLLFTNVTSQIINSWPNKKLLNYPYLEQLKDILPGLLLAAGMGAIVYTVQLLGLSDIVTLVIQVPLGAALYIGGSKLFRLESFDYVLDMLKDYLSRFRKEGA